ncbi:hypothetical protein P7C71_g2574, partial [Lecanoromycetidae sp. Uapishka_2]
MWSPFITFAPLLLSITYAAANFATLANSTCDLQCQIDTHLTPKLSQQASIVHTSAAIPRWSDFDAPNPGTVVNVATEHDVLVTVRYCIRHNIRFLAQNGGNAWSTTFQIGQNDLVINLRGIRQITFHANNTRVTVQGGAIISEVIDAAYGNETQVLTGNCNCIGTLGAALGGGYSRLMGLYGFGVDNILSLNLVTPQGHAVQVGPKDVDLWWALRGAGPNFGIVTSATMKAYPVPAAQNGAWLGPLVFTEDKIESLVQAINDLVLEPPMAIFLNYVTMPPDNNPSVVAIPFYLNGNETEGRAAFSSIFALHPTVDMTGWSPYNQINVGSDSFCIKGGRKPSYGAGFAKMDPATWRAIWNQYNTFVQNPGTENTTVLVECYSLQKAMSFGDASSSYAFRSSIKFNAVVNTWYADPSLDAKAEAFGSSVRDLWRGTEDLQSNQTYINYANGDEDLQTVYGDNVAKLQAIKQKYDPAGRFNQFFPLT